MSPGNIDDVESLRAAIALGARPSFLFFWGHSAKTPNVNNHVLSQWWPAKFVLNGQQYRTAEHYMMAEKARLFGDEACRAQIIDTASPADVKALGREVHGFDEERWVENRFEIAVRGNIAKFSQNPELRDWLVGTAPMVLVEASPVDTIWGIGLAADDKRASDPVKWRGLNLLGFALMKARDRLKLAALLLFLALHVLAVGTLVRLDVPELAFLALDGVEILPSSCGASFSLAMLPSFVGPTLSQPSHHGRFAAPTST